MIAFKHNGVCPACGSGPFIHVHDSCIYHCEYCWLSIAEELLDSIPNEYYLADLLYKVKKTWMHRVETANQLSTPALLDLLKTRGIDIVTPTTHPLTSPTQASLNADMDTLAKDLKKMILEATFSKPPKSIPPPEPVWSYEDNARSEFILDEGTGLE